MEHTFKHEQLPSGKLILWEFDGTGAPVREQHSHGDIGIAYDFHGGVASETYFVKNRLCSRRTYEKARVAYPDMPPANEQIEDCGAELLRLVSQQQRRNKEKAEQRLAESAESRFPRPESTNWLRVIAGDKSHLVIFASRDWKLLSRERLLPSGREWLHEFGFHGHIRGSENSGGGIADGLVVGFEVTGKRSAMLAASQSLLVEINNYVANPPEVSRWSGSIRPRPKPRKPPIPAWHSVLPPLIDFLSNIEDDTVTIFNHHR